MSERPLYQQRVIKERVDLSGKIERLEFFLDSPPKGILVDATTQRLLAEQLIHMRAYLGVLIKRVEKFDKEKE